MSWSVRCFIRKIRATFFSRFSGSRIGEVVIIKTGTFIRDGYRDRVVIVREGNTDIFFGLICCHGKWRLSQPQLQPPTCYQTCPRSHCTFCARHLSSARRQRYFLGWIVVSKSGFLRPRTYLVNYFQGIGNNRWPFVWSKNWAMAEQSATTPFLLTLIFILPQIGRVTMLQIFCFLWFTLFHPDHVRVPLFAFGAVG